MKKYFVYALRLAAALIMLQTLYYKFTAAPESVFIFGKLGMEPQGRIMVGFAELVASALLLSPRGWRKGAMLTMALMCGAIFFHLTVLDIEVRGDGGLLFALACITLACALLSLLLSRKKKI